MLNYEDEIQNYPKELHELYSVSGQLIRTSIPMKDIPYLIKQSNKCETGKQVATVISLFLFTSYTPLENNTVVTVLNIMRKSNVIERFLI